LTSSAPVLGIVPGRACRYHRDSTLPPGTYNFNIIDNYTGAVTVTDRYVGSRNAGFGTPVTHFMH
jgi:hypothetical protein